jgi:hypothetical protein
MPRFSEWEKLEDNKPTLGNIVEIRRGDLTQFAALFLVGKDYYWVRTNDKLEIGPNIEVLPSDEWREIDAKV